ncbi:hypothetical protein FraQA3DRAFT_6357 [Frankia sp. QA3]|nr:hypothetical protein FraQA3DRAFT_6357 [Frankia sp. QA3]
MSAFLYDRRRRGRAGRCPFGRYGIVGVPTAVRDPRGLEPAAQDGV